MESVTKSNHNYLAKNRLSGKISEWGELWTIFQSCEESTFHPSTPKIGSNGNHDTKTNNNTNKQQ